jgi:hypothetical protein
MNWATRLVLQCVISFGIGVVLAELGITSKDTPRRFWFWNITLNLVVTAGLLLLAWRLQ